MEVGYLDMLEGLEKHVLQFKKALYANIVI